jgi:hypothetical protein
MYYRYKLLKAIFNIIKANKMNPNTENIENANITENIVNTVFHLEIDLGPPPQMVRHPSYDEYEEVGDVELIADREFQGYNTPNDFVMPTPCPKCYWVCCNEDCSEEKETIEPRRVCFEEEEDSVPLPLPLTRMFTNADLPEDLSEDHHEEADLVPLLPLALTPLPLTPLPLTRSFTNSHWPHDLPQDLYISEDNSLEEEDKKDEVQEGEKQEDEDEDDYIDDYKEEYRYLYKR